VCLIKDGECREHVVILPARIFVGLVFLAAPIIIHFFNRRRSVLLDFSTVRFFRITAVRASKIRRLKRLLLLCSRCLLIAVIVALFAKPYSKSNPFAALSDPNGAISAGLTRQ